MSPDDAIRPFRWDVTRRSELGSLARRDVPQTYPQFEADLVASAARVVATAGDSDLVFLGRSPESLFHLLSGLLADSSWRDRLGLLNLALRLQPDPGRDALRAVRAYLQAVGLSPEQIHARPRPVAFVDVVASGDSLGKLIGFLQVWSDDTAIEWRSVARKIRIVGLTWRTKTSPNTWRWQQHAEWAGALPPRAIKNVSAPGRLLSFVASDVVPKMTREFGPGDWANPDSAKPWRSEVAADAVALALHLYELGLDRGLRQTFARKLTQQDAVKDPWLRSLALEIKR